MKMFMVLLRMDCVSANIDVLTVQEDNRSGLADPEVLKRAIALNRILFSQDDDLLAEANMLQKSGVTFPGVVFARQS